MTDQPRRYMLPFYVLAGLCSKKLRPTAWFVLLDAVPLWARRAFRRPFLALTGWVGRRYWGWEREHSHG